MARVEGNGAGKQLLLFGHIDVVSADPTAWNYDPFSATIANGFFPRGAVEIKHLVDAMLTTVVSTRLLGLPLQRDLISGSDLLWPQSQHNHSPLTLAVRGGYATPAAGRCPEPRILPLHPQAGGDGDPKSVPRSGRADEHRGPSAVRVVRAGCHLRDEPPAPRGSQAWRGVADQSSPIAILWGATDDARLQTSPLLELVSKHCTPSVRSQHRYKTLALTAAMKNSARLDRMEHL